MIEPPLPFGNAAARWYYVLLKGLVARGHQVTAFAACSKSSEIETARQLFPAPEYDLRCYPYPRRNGLAAKWETLRRPYSYMFSDHFRNELASEIKHGTDLLHFEQLWSAWLGDDLFDRTLVAVHYLSQVDLHDTRLTNWRGQFDLRMMSSTEKRLLRKVKNVNCLSPRDAQVIRNINPDCQLNMVRHGIDTSLYTFIPDAERVTAPVISLIGSMNWYPTFSAAERLLTQLWPEIKKQIPEAKLQIVGWKARQLLQAYLETEDVVIAENVPDIEPYFKNTNVLLYAPSHSSGIQVKLLEAMAYGIPIVTNNEGAEGLLLQDGVQAEICNDNDDLVMRTIELLRSTEKQNKQRRAAHELLETYFSSRPTVDRIEEIYGKILQK